MREMLVLPKDEFLRNLIISFGLHLGLLLLALGAGKIVHKIFKSNDVEIIRSAIRVDVIGMPKFTVQELKKMEATEVPPVEKVEAKGEKEEIKPSSDADDVIKKDDLVIEKKGKVAKKSFLNILSNYSKKDVQKKDAPKGSRSGKGVKNLNALILEGNRLSKGSALTGDFSDEENSEFSSYVQSLPGQIRQFWKLPTYLLEKDLRCRIKIFLSTQGQLLKVEVQESSGVEEFDKRAERAIRDAAPFSKPSQTVGLRLSGSGIILGFPL